MSERRLAIAGYHKIGEPAPGGWETWFSISELEFRTQLAWFREHGWEAIDRDALVAGLLDPSALPRKALVLTFDDAYKSLTRTARDVLRQLGLPAVVFVPTRYVGGRNDFEEGAEPEEEIATWDDLRTLAGNGFSIESHGVTHRHFSLLSSDEREQELVESKASLENELDTRVRLFAYPYGDDDGGPPTLRAALSGSGYEAAFLYGGTAVDPATVDRFRVPRIAMGPDTDLANVLGDR